MIVGRMAVRTLNRLTAPAIRAARLGQVLEDGGGLRTIVKDGRDPLHERDREAARAR